MEQQLYGSKGEAPGLIIRAYNNCSPNHPGPVFLRASGRGRYGIKVRCYGEYVGEYIGNLGNILGTH